MRLRSFVLGLSDSRPLNDPPPKEDVYAASIVPHPHRNGLYRRHASATMSGWLKRRHRDAVRRLPFSTEWRTIVEKNVP